MVSCGDGVWWCWGGRLNTDETAMTPIKADWGGEGWGVSWSGLTRRWWVDVQVEGAVEPFGPQAGFGSGYVKPDS